MISDILATKKGKDGDGSSWEYVSGAQSIPEIPHQKPSTPQKIVFEEVRQFEETSRKLKDLKERLDALKEKGADKK
ncbi:hypothetical protein HYT05_03845 [Candidatus Kaiserbacteria bacterium]|nr:hypothetical protein [Candidatus Kaiserbacteria bacterium]